MQHKDNRVSPYEITVATSNIPDVEKSSPEKNKKEAFTTTFEVKQLDEKLSDAHARVLPKSQIITILMIMSIGYLISFIDQTGITVALPYVAQDLNATKTISWAGSAALLSNTVFQVLYGRLSDIFGRKIIIIVCLFILSMGDLACGLAKTDLQFFIFRAMAGIGNGGVSCLTNVILSDVVPLSERGKYQGILGSMVGIGNSIGPFVAAGFVEHSTWRGFFWLLCPVILLVCGLTYKMTPDSKPNLSMKESLKAIDYLGFFCSTAGLVLILVPLNGGGVTYAWSSALVISMFTIGGCFLALFILIEWKYAKLPMIPLRLFKRYELCLLLASNFFFGLVYYSILYYIPYYFEVIKGSNIIITSCFTLSIVLPQAISSVIAGRTIAYMGHYIYVLQFGFTLWFLGTCLLLLFNQSTNVGVNIIVLIIIGTGVGCIFQPMLIAVQAQSLKADRAVVISTRNVIRSLGGSVGISISSLTMGNSLLKKIESDSKASTLPISFLNYLKENLYSKIDISTLSNSEATIFKDLYMTCLKNVFYVWIPCMGLCFIFSFLIKDTGLQCIDQTRNNSVNSEYSANSSSTEKPDAASESDN